MAIDGDTAVVGAPDDDGGRGTVYIFARTGDSWGQTAKLTASDGGSHDNLGSSVAIEGDTIVAGAPRDDLDPESLNGNEGSAYTFARTGAPARTETAKLTATDGAADEELGRDVFGFSVAIDGDTIVAGAPGDEVGGNPAQGSASIFFPTRAPTARDDTYTTGEYRRLNVPAPGVLRNDSDPERQSLSAELVRGPRHGRLTLRGDGSFTYTPDRNFNGGDSFSYRACDDASPSLCDTATVRLTVTPVDDGGRPAHDRGRSARCRITGSARGEVIRGTPGDDVDLRRRR